MRLMNLLTAAAMAPVASASLGFALYRELRSNPNGSSPPYDNAGQITDTWMPLSSTVFMYIQIIEGYDQSQIIKDFQQFARTHGPNGVRVIPRIRYGKNNGDYTVEPKNWDTVMADVKRWTKVFTDVQVDIEIPVIQAGFLGLWGEWHGSHFAQAHGDQESAVNQARKKELVKELRKTGVKIALRYPMDHKALGYQKDKQITMHNDCMMDSGPQGADRGTFPSNDIATWRKYVIENISGNTYGGEPCGQSDGTGEPDGTPYDWSDTAAVCGANGLIKYIKDNKIAYLNPGNPTELNDLFWGCADKNIKCSCINGIKDALEANT